MRTYTIAAIPGDGIGKDVIEAGIKVIRAAEEVRGDVKLSSRRSPGAAATTWSTARMMPEDGLKILEPFDAIYLGAVRLPEAVPDHVSLWGLLLPIRKGFDLYVNLRPIQLLAGPEAPCATRRPPTSTSMCIRENTEGEYAGVGGRVHQGTDRRGRHPDDRLHPHGVERIMRYAFELAQRQRRKKVTSVTKSNAMQHSDGVLGRGLRRGGRRLPGRSSTTSATSTRWRRAWSRHPESLDVLVAPTCSATS